MKIFSFWKLLMETMPAMEEVMWWRTGAFISLSSFLVSWTPLFIVMSRKMTTARMIRKGKVKTGYKKHTRATLKLGIKLYRIHIVST